MIEGRDTFKDITELVLACLDGTISSDEFAILQARIKTSKEVRRHYLECLALCISLNRYEEESINLPVIQSLPKEEYYNDILQALAENEKVAVAVDVEKTKKEPEPYFFELEDEVVVQRRISRLSVFAFMVSAAAMLCMAVLVWFNPVKPVVAVLTESRNAVWAGSDALIEGDDIRQGPLALSSGYAGITLTNGVEIVMHGPVTIDIESETQVFLSRGSIFSKVSKGAGEFLVRTAGATVVDYGTEFAVEVDSSGSTAAHVFVGEVELRAGADIVKHGPVKRLLAKQAAAVDVAGTITDVKFAPEQYVTSVPSKYDMAVLDSDPAAYWRFANFGDFPVNEINLTTYDASYVGNIDFTDSSDLNRDIHSQALKLDGQGGHVSVKIGWQNANRGWSYSMWIRPELLADMQDRSNHYYILVGEGRYGYLNVSDDGTLEHCYRYNDGTADFRQVGKENIVSGRWYHIAMTVDNDGTKRLYINGTEASEPIEKENTSLGTGSSCKEIIIGTVFEESPAFKKGPMDKPFKGDISQVALYGRTLSQKEIKKLYLSSRN